MFRRAAWAAAASAMLIAGSAVHGEETTAGDRLRATRALAEEARAAVLAEAPDADARVARAWEAAGPLDAPARGEVETKLHVLRTRMLEVPEGSARAALREDLASLEAQAEAGGLAGAHAYALLYGAELTDDADAHAAALRRALAIPAAPETRAPLARLHTTAAGGAERRGDRGQAIALLRRAVRLAANDDLRLGAREQVALARVVHEPLADLLLRESARDPANAAAWLEEALDTLEEVKVSELREYFGDACLSALEETRAERVPGALLLYPVLLPDRVELIVGRGERLERIVSPMRPEEVVEATRRLRGALQDRTSPRYRALAARLYEGLIRPLGEDAFAGDVTLTFVPTGALRAIPIAALFDARTKRFLVEQVPIATLPTLRIRPPRAIDSRRARLLLAGVTRSVEGFQALPAVERELAAAASEFTAEQRVDEAFTASSFEALLDEQAFDIVHIASHGRFGDRPEESYLLAWDGRLTLPELAGIVERTRHRTSRPLELLVLSACETAIGDDRAVLGLAGVAVQSGARSAVATLWRVGDEAAARLLADFYARLGSGGESRARALRGAQLSLLADERFRHPIHWAAFLLVSGWL